MRSRNTIGFSGLDSESRSEKTGGAGSAPWTGRFPENFSGAKFAVEAPGTGITFAPMGGAKSSSELTGLLLLIPLGISIGVGGLMALFIVRTVQDHLKYRRRANASRHGDRLSRPIRALLFERPGRWLAVKSASAKTVQTALGLSDGLPCSWDEGLVEARDEKLFISPPVDGWVLVVGSSLPDPADDPDECFHFLRRISLELGHVQYFGVNRVVNHHAWAIVDSGDVFRAYAWAEEVLWNQGIMTAAERELKLMCLAYGAVSTRGAEGQAHNCERVSRLAAEWSVDPAVVAAEAAEGEPGIVGHAPRCR